MVEFERSFGKLDWLVRPKYVPRRILVDHQFWLGVGAVITGGVLQGVFAVGDGRTGSTKCVASAVGEGSMSPRRGRPGSSTSPAAW